MKEEGERNKRKCPRETTEKQSPTNYREISNFVPVPMKVELKEEREEFVPVTILDSPLPATSSNDRSTSASIMPVVPPSTSSTGNDSLPSTTPDSPDSPDIPDISDSPG